MFRFILTLALIAVVIWLYVKFIRPELAQHPRLTTLYQHADTFWANVIARLRIWWDAILPLSLIVIPELADLTSQMLTTINWAAFEIKESTKAFIQMAGVMLAAVRAAIMRASAKVADQQ